MHFSQGWIGVGSPAQVSSHENKGWLHSLLHILQQLVQGWLQCKNHKMLIAFNVMCLVCLVFLAISTLTLARWHPRAVVRKSRAHARVARVRHFIQSNATETSMKKSEREDYNPFVERGITIHPSEPWLVDEYGRMHVFHGVTIVLTSSPWIHRVLRNNSMLDDLVDSGINLVRLGIMWPGAEKREGWYDKMYFRRLRRTINSLTNRGIYVILYFHQECLNYQDTNIPDWLWRTFPRTDKKAPWPFDKVQTMDQACMTKEASHAFQLFYGNYSGSINRLAALWQHVAKKVEDIECLGFDLINKPSVGDYFEDPNLGFPGEATKKNLLPAYDKISKAILDVLQDRLIFYEPVYKEGQVLWAGLGDAIKNPYTNISATSFHVDCHSMKILTQDTQLQNQYVINSDCNYSHARNQIEAALQAVTQMGTTGIVNIARCQSSQADMDADCTNLMDLCDDNFLSWTAVGYPQGWYINGAGYSDTIKLYTRVYAYAISGVPIQTHFNSTSREYMLHFTADPDIYAPTGLFVPLKLYPEGYRLTVYPELFWEAQGSVVLVYHQGTIRTYRGIVVKILPMY